MIKVVFFVCAGHCVQSQMSYKVSLVHFHDKLEVRTFTIFFKYLLANGCFVVFRTALGFNPDSTEAAASTARGRRRPRRQSPESLSARA